jgi:hypothetical protein
MRTPNQHASDTHEQQVSDAFEGIYGKASRVPGSGNQVGKPGDVKVPGEWYVECKTTQSESLSVKYDWLVKIRNEGFVGGLRSLLSIRFANSKTKIFYVIEDVELYELLKSEQDWKRRASL